MKTNEFEISFITGQKVSLKAFNTVEACILAQAEQIKKGFQYKIKDVLLKVQGGWVPVEFLDR
jgi:hypothetical protein